MTLAKSLGGGFPIGACLAAGEAATTFAPWRSRFDFRRQPLACAAALETLAIIEDEDLRGNAARMGERLVASFTDLARTTSSAVDHIRGRGLLLGVQLVGKIAPAVAAECLERGVVVNAVAPDVLRLAPPLIISADECDLAVATISSVLDEMG